jgi:hypothetical protein
VTLRERIGATIVQAMGFDAGSSYSHSTVEWVATECAKAALEAALRIQCGAAVAVVDGGTAYVELRDVVKADRIRRLLSELEDPK